eukprot:g219.t1
MSQVPSTGDRLSISDAQLDSLIAECLRSHGPGQLSERSYSGSSTPSENTSQLRESIRSKLMELALRQGTRPLATNQFPRADAAQVGINQTPISLGFLADDLEYICTSSLEDELRYAELYDQEGNEETKESRELADLLEWKHNFTEFVECKIPLPDHNNEKRSDVVEKMRHRVPVSSQRLPSSIMYTVFNSTSSINSIKPIYDGEKLAIGSSDSTIRVFDVTTPIDQSIDDDARFKRRRFEDENPYSNGHLSAAPPIHHHVEKPIKEGNFENSVFRGHTKAVTSTSWFEADHIFLSSSLDGSIRLWSEPLQANICIFKGHLFPVLDVDVCPFGYYFLTGSMDRTARLWCTESLEPIRICPGNEGAVEYVKWHQGCSYFGATSSDGVFRLWDLSVAKPVRHFKHTGRVITSFCFGSDGVSLICGFDDGKLEVTDLRKSSELLAVASAHEGPIWDVSCSRGNGNLLATGGQDSCVRLWSLPERQCTQVYKTRSCCILSTYWTFSNLLITTGEFVFCDRMTE